MTYLLKKLCTQNTCPSYLLPPLTALDTIYRPVHLYRHPNVKALKHEQRKASKGVTRAKLEERTEEQEMEVADQTPTREQRQAARRAEKFERRAIRRRIAHLDQVLARTSEKAYAAHYRAVNLSEKVEEERSSLVEALISYERRKAARSKQRARKHHTELLGRFFRLPREIRDLIYHHAWSGTIISFYQELTWNFADHDLMPRGPIITAEYSSTGKYRANHILPWEFVIPENGDTCKGPRHAQEYSWIWTSQQIYAESTEQFYRYTRFKQSAPAEDHYYHMCAHSVPRCKLFELAYAFPKVLLARNVLLDAGYESSFRITNDGVLASIVELLAMAEKGEEKRALRVNLIKDIADAKPFQLKDLVPASTPHSMASRAFEELVLKDLERVGWDITVDEQGT